jgi:hypothetical protein
MNSRQSGTILIIGTVVLLAVGGVALIVNALDQVNSSDQTPTALAISTVVDSTLEPDTVVIDSSSINQDELDDKDVAKTTDIPVPQPTFTPVPESTPTQLSDQVASGTKTLEFTDSVFLRSGPGTNYDKLGSEPAGYVAPVTGKSEDGTWYQIAYGARNRVWVSADWAYIEGGTNDIPIVQAPATPTIMATTTTVIAATATQASIGLDATSSDAISGKTFSIDAMFESGVNTPRFLVGETFNADMRIVNSSSSYVTFGAWGIHTNLYPNFLYIFNGDRPADQIGANTEYSWDNHPVSITSPGLHYLQMGVCLDNAANCLASKAPGEKWYILSEAIPVTISESRLSPVPSEGSPIEGTYFAAEKSCVAGTTCSTNYSVNEKIWLNLRIRNTSSDDKSFGAWGVFANPHIKRYFNGDGDADKVGAGTEYSWRDWIAFDTAGTYDLQMVVCLDTSSACKTSAPPGNNWHFLSGAIPVTIK